jgi:mannose-1-phosphate guanylyltransferase
MTARVIPVIMCGGAGTRLWPVSRESMPKQFVPLVGQGSTFQQMLARISDPTLFARPIVITNADFRFVVAEQLRERGVEADIVLEPLRRDSGPAVAVSAVLAAERDRGALVLVLAADHVVRKPDAFREACGRAAVAAAEGRIVTFGIEPTYPATNYGYIRPGEKLNGASVRAVAAFVEKPDAATAAGYVADRYLWNSGNFLFHAATMLGEIERFEPAMAEAATAAVRGLTRDLDFLRLAAGNPGRANLALTLRAGIIFIPSSGDTRDRRLYRFGISRRWRRDSIMGNFCGRRPADRRSALARLFEPTLAAQPYPRSDNDKQPGPARIDRLVLDPGPALYDDRGCGLAPGKRQRARWTRWIRAPAPGRARTRRIARRRADRE